ncbi:hypothetical protein CEXT_484791 [Caerostris extrusa]|uniref:Uncharacterized protein n=1 Tax=Caerostris extrusa TaxID=172846 RepID=A0AAV4Y3J9_CAEEX|nr:hypothetical protein CEXT_484791 [Caerostris extrusa]
MGKAVRHHLVLNKRLIWLWRVPQEEKQWSTLRYTQSALKETGKLGEAALGTNNNPRQEARKYDQYPPKLKSFVIQ